VNRVMSFQDPPRRQRPPRYPALAEYEDGYQGFASFADAAGQRPPWDQSWNEARDEPWDEPGRSAAPTFAQQTSWDLMGQQAAGELPRRTSGAFRAVEEDDQVRPRTARHAAAHGARRSADGRAGDRRAGRSGRPRSRGLAPGALAGFLAAAVALGVANLVAAFVRPQASPIIAVGGAFIDRTPSALKNYAVAKFGENDKNMLLLSMYVTIALMAIAIGMLAWRRLWIGVAGIGLFGLFGAFVAITRPESHVTDVIPPIVGGIAGIAAIALLARAGLPRTRAAAAWARGR
jgi:hypothetical protein